MPENNKKRNYSSIIFYVILIVLVIVVIALLLGRNNQNSKSYGEIITLFQSDKVKSFTIKGSTLTVTDLDDKTYKTQLFSYEIFFKQIGLDGNTNPYQNLKTWNYESDNSSFWVNLLPYLVLIAISIGFMVFMLKRMSNESGKISTFSRANINYGQGSKQKKYFSDVAGCEEEKEELKEVVDYLKNPSKYRKLGAKIPRGVLLVGRPGTGKTLLAKACAGEADVPFLSISGSDFVEMFVGVGASRVRDLFNTAKKSPASIIFIDEIDAVGRHRGAGLGGGNDEREQTLNQLLVELDGFGTNDGVIVIAATNRPDILDPALLRPGRFDRQIAIFPPNLEGRKEILKVHARNKPLASDVNFDHIAMETSGFTGADLANLLNEAALIAARKNKSLIDQSDLDDAYTKVSVGTQKKSAKIKESEKKKTAYHEAGHAITSFYLPTGDPVRQISIIPSGLALGYTLSVPEEDKYSVFKSELNEKIVMLLGGRAAEEIVFGDVSGGASNDISRATDIAKDMVTRYGMSELGTIRFGTEHDRDSIFLGRDFSSTQDYSEKTAALIDEEVKKIIDQAYAKAKEILSEHRDQLDLISEYLVKFETMDGDDFKSVMEGEDVNAIILRAQERKEQIEKENEEKRIRDEQKRKKQEEERRRRQEENRNRQREDDDRFKRYR